MKRFWKKYHKLTNFKGRIRRLGELLGLALEGKNSRGRRTSVTIHDQIIDYHQKDRECNSYLETKGKTNGRESLAFATSQSFLRVEINAVSYRKPR